MHERPLRASLFARGLSVAVMTLLVACSGTAPTVAPTPVPTVAPTPVPTSTLASATPIPGVGHIDHPTGPNDVVLRLESGGGLVPFGFFATQAPTFTLYGDNTVIFRPIMDPTGTGLPPFVKAVMNAAQVDALLNFALGQGHLATARGPYSVPNVADAPTTYFTLNAGGIRKVVEVYALGIENQRAGSEAADYQAFAELSAVLGDFAKEVRRGQVVSAETYVPARYRAILTEAQGMDGVRDWPWKDVHLDDFQVDGAHISIRMAAITADQAARVTTVPSGGVRGIPIASPDGKKQFSLSLRPMLPGDNVQP